MWFFLAKNSNLSIFLQDGHAVRGHPGFLHAFLHGCLRTTGGHPQEREEKHSQVSACVWWGENFCGWKKPQIGSEAPLMRQHEMSCLSCTAVVLRLNLSNIFFLMKPVWFDKCQSEQIWLLWIRGHFVLCAPSAGKRKPRAFSLTFIAAYFRPGIIPNKRKNSKGGKKSTSTLQNGSKPADIYFATVVDVQKYWPKSSQTQEPDSIATRPHQGVPKDCKHPSTERLPTPSCFYLPHLWQLWTASQTRKIALLLTLVFQITSTWLCSLLVLDIRPVRITQTELCCRVL